MGMPSKTVDTRPPPRSDTCRRMVGSAGSVASVGGCDKSRLMPMQGARGVRFDWCGARWDRRR
jgi:hypothetical protein